MWAQRLQEIGRALQSFRLRRQQRPLLEIEAELITQPDNLLKRVMLLEIELLQWTNKGQRRKRKTNNRMISRKNWWTGRKNSKKKQRRTNMTIQR